MGIKISELTKTNSVASTDLLVLETSEGTKSVEVNKVGGLPLIDCGTVNSANSKKISVSNVCRYHLIFSSSNKNRIAEFSVYHTADTIAYRPMTQDDETHLKIEQKSGVIYITSTSGTNANIYINPLTEATKTRLIVEDLDKSTIPTGTGVWHGLSSGGSNERVLTKAEYDALPDTKLTDGVTYYISDVGEGIKQNVPSAYIVNVNGTTDSYGAITVNCKNEFKSVPFVLSNVSGTLSTPYSVKVNSYSDSVVTLRIRNMSDNSAVTNTSVNFPAMIIGVE